MTGSTSRVTLIVLVGQQTGFDPANPQVGMAPPPPPQYYGRPQAPQGGLLRGAAGGPALGAVGGGDAGKGRPSGRGGCDVYTAQRQNAMGAAPVEL